MGAEGARIEDARAWLSKAALDLKAAAHEISAPDECLWADIVFHSQQAAEKALKGFLAWHDVAFRKTHNIEEIGQQCVAVDPTLQTIVDLAAPLTEYAWRFRYPGEPTEPGQAEAEGALRAARRVYEDVLTRLPSGVRPY